ncbi:vWA domain-containing protein [Shewanella fidelis]|uniref:VWA domain-containing protein n=1 Tax=Shewanella fidelis TaxID=173509 RepID=A0AAW8NLB6_9GAMM|nr:VWA domain-containing protein [Shewanella fidelis]MDR8523341.1 VWA domain-containing protein [Shewanella fidelis]MDW4811333.1 VWA domain-containing protein [Shewanella fidelis]MDW4815454.1 VWA domain-containing protein [Shewanella fidelis]MDW4819544.1 VWA domain-containing protein [Shewanella fidelis]MDW4824482.1 VWA domain-containing protein [Shewanella fidelis]
MHFLRPEWFIALVPLALLLLILFKSKAARSSWDHYIAPHLAKVLVNGVSGKKRNNVYYLAIAWLVAVFALSGPALEKRSLPVYESTQGRVLVMDMSLSMYADDLAPNRLTQAKYRATDLIAELSDGETGLIAYAGDAFAISPLTRDKATLLNLLPTLTPNIMPTRGSNLEAAITQAQSLLSQGGHLRGDIVLFTDGVSAAQFKRAESVLKDSPYRLAIMAFGSQQGAPIKLPDGQLLRDNANQVVIAKTDYALLDELANNAGGIMVANRADGSDVTQVKQWLANTKDTKASDLQGETWVDLGPYVALLLLLPTLLSFRNGMLATLALFVILQPNGVAQASTWDNLWQTQDQQAMQAYKAAEYEAAANQFIDPQWQASALYKAGQFEQALNGFEQDNSAKGLYNQGNALMQLEKYQQAQKRYEAALEQQPDFAQAKSNLELAKKLQQQQQQQQQQDNDQNQGSDQQNQSDDPQQSQNEQSQKQDQQSQDSQSQGQQNQSDNGQQQDNQPNSEQSEQQSEKTDDASKPKEQQQSQSDEAQEQQNNSEQQGNQSTDNKQQPNNDAEMQASASEPQAQQTDEAKEPLAQQAQQSAATKTQDQPEQTDNETQQVAATALPTDEPLPPEMERALRAIADDPQVLLRNKMQLEYQKRRHQGINSKETEQW